MDTQDTTDAEDPRFLLWTLFASLLVFGTGALFFVVFGAWFGLLFMTAALFGVVRMAQLLWTPRRHHTKASSPPEDV